MSKYPDEQLYLFSANGSTCGRITNQPAEVANKFCLEVRSSHIANGLMLFMEQEFSRVLKNQEEATSHFDKNYPIVPKAQDIINKLKKRCRLRNRNVVQLGHNQMKVVSSKCSTVAYTIYDCKNCPCGKERVSTYPCEHMVDCALAQNKTPESLDHENYTTKKWKEQYEGISIDKVSDYDVHSECIGVHALPPVCKVSKGRKKLYRRKIGVVEKVSKKLKQQNDMSFDL